MLRQKKYKGKKFGELVEFNLCSWKGEPFHGWFQARKKVKVKINKTTRGCKLTRRCDADGKPVPLWEDDECLMQGKKIYFVAQFKDLHLFAKISAGKHAGEEFKIHTHEQGKLIVTRNKLGRWEMFWPFYERKALEKYPVLKDHKFEFSRLIAPGIYSDRCKLDVMY